MTLKEAIVYAQEASERDDRNNTANWYLGWKNWFD